jgi:hypothetical protein
MSQAIQSTEILRGARYLLSLSLWVFVRRQFGARVVGDLFVTWGFSWFCLWLYLKLRSLFFPLLPDPIIAPLVLKIMIAVILVHCFGIMFRWNVGEVHSYSTGRPLPFWRHMNLSDPAVKQFFEPLLGFVVAYAILHIDMALACWIATASIAVFIEEQLSRTSSKTRVLDVVDSRIEAQSLHQGVQRRLTPTAPASADSSVVAVPEQSCRSSANVPGIIDQLDPELKRMVDSSATPQTENPK